MAPRTREAKAPAPAAPKTRGVAAKATTAKTNPSKTAKAEAPAHKGVNGTGPAASSAARSTKRKRAGDDHDDVVAAAAPKRTLKRTAKAASKEPEEPPRKRVASEAAKAAKTAKPAKPAKPAKAATPAKEATPAPLAPLNEAPTEVLAVFICGNGDSGELGLGPAVQDASRPRLIPALDPEKPDTLHVVHFACGGMHTAAVTKDNKIVTWGVNDNGALGRDTAWEGGLRDMDAEESDSEAGELNPLESTPTAIPASSFPPGTKFVQVAAGDSCTFALTDTGDVYGWGTFKDPQGDEKFGYDADGSIIKRQVTPVKIQELGRITQIACGANHALALDATGVVWSWGCDEQNQLGRHTTGRHAQGPLTPDPIHIRDVKHVACGSYHSLAVDKKGHVWGWGFNGFGETGNPKTAGGTQTVMPFPMKVPGFRGKEVLSIGCGHHHSGLVTADGQCYMWGQLDWGQLGIEFTPEQVEDAHLIHRDEYDRPRICLKPTPVPGIGKISHVGCGGDHTIFVTKEGSAYATGFNPQNQLGLGPDADNVKVPELMRSKGLKDRTVTFADCGAQFSVLGAAFKPAQVNGA